jgi:hypothetical protein
MNIDLTSEFSHGWQWGMVTALILHEIGDAFSRWHSKRYIRREGERA